MGLVKKEAGKSSLVLGNSGSAKRMEEIVKSSHSESSEHDLEKLLLRPSDH